MAVIHPGGTIILASQVPDTNGTNPKDRPVLLLVDLLDTDQDAFGVAISSTYAVPLPPASVLIPYDPRGSCQTGLTVPSIAVCDWPVVIGTADILRRLGFCTPLPLNVVLSQLPLLQPKPAFQYTPNATRPSGS